MDGNTREMPGIIKIVMESYSGYSIELYRDKLIITSESINYQYTPYIEIDNYTPQKWSYKTNSPLYGQLWNDVKMMIPEIFGLPDSGDWISDSNTYIITVFFENKQKGKRDFTFCEEPVLTEWLGLIKKMVPSCEKMPNVLKIGKDN